MSEDLFFKCNIVEYHTHMCSKCNQIIHVPNKSEYYQLNNNSVNRHIDVIRHQTHCTAKSSTQPQQETKFQEPSNPLKKYVEQISSISECNELMQMIEERRNEIVEQESNSVKQKLKLQQLRTKSCLKQSPTKFNIKLQTNQNSCKHLDLISETTPMNKLGYM